MDHGHSPYPPHDTPHQQRSSHSLPSSLKRQRPFENDVDSAIKKAKTVPEEPLVYSDNVRKKLAATNRTGQACDRCKERKMKCDPDPVACQPCRQKQLRCYTTDRVTGQSRERGQTGRDESEITHLRDQLAAYQRLYGNLPDSPTTSPSTTRRKPPGPIPSPSQSAPGRDPPWEDIAPQHFIPTSKYTGWSVPSSTNEPLHAGPIDYTDVSLLDYGSIDTADFACDIMHEYPATEVNRFNFSNNSLANTMAHKQIIQNLELPPRDQVLKDVNNFFIVMWGFIPIVHKKTLLAIIDRLYNDPMSLPIAEKLQVVQILGIMAHQDNLRNHSNSIEKLDRSFHYLHYSLGFYTHLMGQKSLAALQALTLILVQLRNFPKPGYSWLIANQLVVLAVSMDYHRDPDRLVLPPEECNQLAKEMRKRVFHCILGIAVTTGCRVGKPCPWQSFHWDVPLPMPMLDDDLDAVGVGPASSGMCDYWECLHVAKLVPLTCELYNHVLSVRRPEAIYLKTVEAMRTKIEAWRSEWDEYPRHPDPNVDSLRHAHTLLFDTWAAELLLYLHHPKVCTSTSRDVQNEHLSVCHRAATRLLRNFHILSERYKACDFTWHSTSAYVCGFGVTLQIYKNRAGLVSDQERQKIRNELAGWVSLIQMADLLLRTDRYLEKKLKPLAQSVEDLYEQYTTKNQPRGSFSHVNGISAVTTSIDHEHGSRANSVSSNVVSQNGSMYSRASISHPSQPYQSQIPYMVPPSTMPPTPFAAYTPSPNMTTYANFPTSLAPLLNDSVAGSYSQMQQSTTPISAEVAMNFHPQLYSSENVTMVWPHVGTPQ